MSDRGVANRSGKITCEFKDKGGKLPHLVFFIDGKKIHEVNIPLFVTTNQLSSSFWRFEEVLKEKPGIFGDMTKTKVVKIGHKEFTKTYGIKPSVCSKVMNGMIHDRMVAPYKEFDFLFRSRKGKIDTTRWYYVVNNYDLLKQAMNDNQKHITPIIAFFGEDPASLRKKIGKNGWKHVCANKFSRNKLLASHLQKGSYTDSKVDQLINLNKYRSSAMSTKAHPELLTWVHINRKLPFSKIIKWGKVQGTQVHRDIVLYNDTKQVATANGYPFNKEWSVRKMQEKHDEYIRLVMQEREEQRRRTDAEYIERINKRQKIDFSTVYSQTEWKLNDTVAKILTKSIDIENEGAEMHHCVGVVYMDRAMSGHYAVVAMNTNGVRSTLGVNVRYDEFGKALFKTDQHYGVYNSALTVEDHVTMRTTVIEALNNMNITKGKYEEAINSN